MKIPLRPFTLKYNVRWPKVIVIHHTAELELNSSGVVLDKSSFQTSKLQRANYQIYKETDPPYHFIVELIDDDYQVIVCKPLFTKCIFNDIPEEFDESIHIGILGDYDSDIPPTRLYSILSYKLIIPFMRLFKITEDKIYLHRELSTEDKITCPGQYFLKNKLITSLRPLLKRVAITRN
jgi:hypothetical protein